MATITKSSHIHCSLTYGKNDEAWIVPSLLAILVEPEIGRSPAMVRSSMFLGSFVDIDSVPIV